MLRYVKIRVDEKRGLTRLKQPFNLLDAAHKKGLSPRTDPTSTFRSKDTRLLEHDLKRHKQLEASSLKAVEVLYCM